MFCIVIGIGIGVWHMLLKTIRNFWKAFTEWSSYSSSSSQVESFGFLFVNHFMATVSQHFIKLCFWANNFEMRRLSMTALNKQTFQAELQY